MEQETFDQRDMTILIVDDEARIRDFVRMNLEIEHYRVIEAENGVEALDQLRGTSTRSCRIRCYDARNGWF